MGGTWIETPAMRNTLRFLWARSEQGAELEIEVVEKRPVDPELQILIVQVRERDHALLGQFGPKYMFALTFSKIEEDRWRMIALALER